MASSSVPGANGSPLPAIQLRPPDEEDKKSAAISIKSSTNGNGHRKMMTNLPKRPPVAIEYTDLVYTVKERSGKWFSPNINKHKTILHGVSGAFRPGELTAIMGPSGAGKSTLMNILAGYKTSNVSGEITINGKKRNLRMFRKMSSYIMQDDCLSQYLTVSEAMDVAANLKLGEKTSAQEKSVVVTVMIN
jgi:ABC-type glutathione transport system ATPase component